MIIIWTPLLKIYRPISDPPAEVPLPSNFSNQAQELLPGQSLAKQWKSV